MGRLRQRFNSRDTAFGHDRLSSGRSVARSGWRSRRGFCVRLHQESGGGFSSLISVIEAELPTVSGLNDTIGTAEPVLGFGTGPGDDPTAEVNGFLKPPPTTPIASVEDDGDIFKANPTGLAGGDAVIASAEIGDGPLGSSGSGSGDFDFYAITGVAAGQTITVDVDTPFPFGD